MNSAVARTARFARHGEIIFLILLTLLAFGFRLFRAGSISLAEDEAAKYRAIQLYKQGRFADVNSEHPMLMKLLAWASLEVGHRWNVWVGAHRGLVAREEALLRMPNLLFGAATTVVIYLLGKQMFGAVGAGAAAFFWAVTPLPIALNRILKEDTLLTFFTFLAFYFFWRGKNATDDAAARRLYTWSGVCFGLALASKYFIHYLGLNLVVWHIAGRAGLDRRPFIQHFGRMMLAMALAFVICNPVILSLTNLGAILDYVAERVIQHHGYNLNGELRMNNFGFTPFGMPWYFYFWVLAVKTPLPILLACLAGLGLLAVERASVTKIFLRVMLVFWFLPYSAVGSKWIRYLLILLPFLFLAAGFAVERLYEWLLRRKQAITQGLVFATAGLLLIVLPLGVTLAWAPYYPLYLNLLGGGWDKAAHYFPHDELYDLGLREAVEYVSRVAPSGAALAADNPMAVEYYLQRLGRRDLHAVALFDPQYVPKPGHYILVQESRRYFETQDLLDFLERRGPPDHVIHVNDVVTSRIYRF